MAFCSALLVSLSLACGGSDRPSLLDPGPDDPPDPPVDTTGQGTKDITVDPSVIHQTIVGWEAHNGSGQHDVPNFRQYNDALMDVLVNEVGVSRVRLEVQSGMENPVDVWQQYKTGAIDYDTYRCKRWETVNDNASPTQIASNGFHYSFLDTSVQDVILPIKQKLEARGEKLYLNLNYVSFSRNCNDNAAVHKSPAEYAEFMLAAFRYLHTQYGLIPDAVEIILEPDNAGGWSGLRIGQAIVATGALLEANGYRPDFIGPSNAGMQRVPTYFDQMISVSGVKQYLSEISYHRYTGVTDANFQQITNRAQQHGLRTSMLEKTGADYHALHEDLEKGLVSAWQQFAIAFKGDGSGGNVLIGVDFTVSPPRPFVAARTKFLRQYFKFIRPGAVRIGASSVKQEFAPLAFVNPGGKQVVVVKAASGGSFNIGGLPAGLYGITYTTDNAYDVQLTDVQLASGQLLPATIPAAGVITIYGK